MCGDYKAENKHKHTPGPWKLNSLDSGTNDDGTIIGPNNTVITADIFGRNAEEAEANAHLIEAAPDMLTALKAIHAAYNSGDVGWDEVGKLIDKSYGAIAKAEGEIK